MLGGMGVNPLIGAAMAKEAGKATKPLKAAFSNAGLQATWCAQGKQAAEYWGSLFNVEVTWFDGQLDAVKQRVGDRQHGLAEVGLRRDPGVRHRHADRPVNKMIDAGIPVIDMDTLIAPLDTINVHSFLAPDNEFMGASVTQALVNAINGEGTIVMTQGALGHTGAQGRARGFNSVVSKFPKIQVLDEQPGDWDVTKVARIWEALLTKYPKIDAAFFHNDDMALAAYKVMQAKGRTETKIGGVDAMPPAIKAVQDGVDVRDGAQSLLPHPRRRDHRRRQRGHQRREDRPWRHPEEHRHRRPGRHQGQRGRHGVDGGAVPDLGGECVRFFASPLADEGGAKRRMRGFIREAATSLVPTPLPQGERGRPRRRKNE